MPTAAADFRTLQTYIEIERCNLRFTLSPIFHTRPPSRDPPSDPSETKVHGKFVDHNPWSATGSSGPIRFTRNPRKTGKMSQHKFCVTAPQGSAAERLVPWEQLLSLTGQVPPGARPIPRKVGYCHMSTCLHPGII